MTDTRRGVWVKRALHLYWRFSRGLTMGARAVVIDGEGRVFLIRHTYAAGWHLPGGGVEPGETLLAALAHELREEGNLEPTQTPVLHGVFYQDAYSNRDHVAVYVVRDFRALGDPVPDREIAAHGFFAPDALPAETTRGTRDRIAEVLNGQPLSERW